MLVLRLRFIGHVGDLPLVLASVAKRVACPRLVVVVFLVRTRVAVLLLLLLLVQFLSFC
jgi:hypothetical protein